MILYAGESCKLLRSHVGALEIFERKIPGKIETNGEMYELINYLDVMAQWRFLLDYAVRLEEDILARLVVLSRNQRWLRRQSELR